MSVQERLASRPIRMLVGYRGSSKLGYFRLTLKVLPPERAD
jgi:hypothetical protein